MDYKIFKLVEHDEPELSKIYYGNQNLMSNYSNFNHLLKQDELKEHIPKTDIIPTKESKLYYDNQGVRQVFKPTEDHNIYRHILAFYPFERMFMDTMYLRLGKSTLAFCNIIDLFSKFAYSKVFVIGGKSQAITSAMALLTFKEFLTEIKEYGYEEKDIGELTLDAGSEFLGDFLKYLNSNEILYYYSNAGDKKRTSPIERFNGTLRLYIEKYRVIYGKIDASVLKIIMNAYNNVKHSGLENSPLEIIQDKKNQTHAEEHYIKLEQENHINTLPIGQSVRVLMDRGPFQKIKPIWSNKVYKIGKILNNTNYQIEGLHGFYHLDELQPINSAFLLNEDKVKIKEEPAELPPSLDEEEFVKPAKVEVAKPEPERELRSSRIRNVVDYKNLNSKGKG